jgi:hypothetical protein
MVEDSCGQLQAKRTKYEALLGEVTSANLKCTDAASMRKAAAIHHLSKVLAGHFDTQHAKMSLDEFAGEVSAGKSAGAAGFSQAFATAEAKAVRLTADKHTWKVNAKLSQGHQALLSGVGAALPKAVERTKLPLLDEGRRHALRELYLATRDSWTHLMKMRCSALFKVFSHEMDLLNNRAVLATLTG